MGIIEEIRFFMVAAPAPILGRDLKMSDQNNWGEPEQKMKFGGS